MTVPSIASSAPEVSAPIRIEGQSNSEVLFNWMTVKRVLWMVEDPDHLESFGSLVGMMAAIRVIRQLAEWKAVHNDDHPALRVPEDEAEIEAAFSLLDKLLRAHFFISAGG